MSYTCIIVDDEPLARKGIKLHVDQLDSMTMVAEFGNAIQAGEFLNQNEVDIIFLDINMPGLTGIEFLKSRTINPAIILTTAYTDYAIEAFELNVIDYLLKPIKFERFYKAVGKAIDYIKLRRNDKTELKEFQEDFVFIKADRKFIKLNYDDIMYIQGMKDYVMIHTPTKKYMTAMNVKTMLSQLPKDLFVRVSKSFIVNLSKIDSVEIDMIFIGDHDIPLGKSYKADFIDKHIKSKLLKR